MNSRNCSNCKYRDIEAPMICGDCNCFFSRFEPRED